MESGTTGDRDAQGHRGKRGTARVQGGGWGALEQGATSSIRDAASRRKVPKASTVPAMPPTSELSCSYKGGHGKRGHSPSGEEPGVSGLALASTRHLARLGAHRQEPGEVELGEEGALHGAELEARQVAEPSLQALGGSGVAPRQEAPQLRGVADHSLQWEAGARQGELVGDDPSCRSPQHHGYQERALHRHSRCGG